MKRQSLILLACLALGCGPVEADRLLFISLDTVRRDHLPTYGYPRSTAPAIDALAQGGIVFENAFSQQTNTNPSHASMFTGLYPHTHGCQFNGQVLASDRVTLAQILAGSGFRRAAFVSGVTMRAAASGLERGFELYDDAFDGKRRDGQVAASRAVSWIRARGSEESYFVFVHFYDAHGPYLPRGRYRRLFHSDDPGPVLPRIPRYQRVPTAEGKSASRLHPYVDRYDALIRYQDDLVDSLLREIDLDRTIVVILSDHGETLGERYQALDHGGQVFDEQIRIPLIVHAPGVPPGRIPDFVETVDLLPTLLELLKVELPNGIELQGRSVVPTMRREEADARTVVFSSARAVSARHADRGYQLRPRGQIHSVRGARWKLIRYSGQERDYVELYDLIEDPAELRDRANLEPAIRDAHLRILAGWLAAGVEGSGDWHVDPELLEQLRALGYAD